MAAQGSPPERSAGFCLPAALSVACVVGTHASLEAGASQAARAFRTTQEKLRRWGRAADRDTVWAFMQTLGMRLVANVAIDDTWSAVRIKAQQQFSST